MLGEAAAPAVPLAAYTSLIAGAGGGGSRAADDPALLRAVKAASMGGALLAPLSPAPGPAANTQALRNLGELPDGDERNAHALVLVGSPDVILDDDGTSASASASSRSGASGGGRARTLQGPAGGADDDDAIPALSAIDEDGDMGGVAAMFASDDAAAAAPSNAAARRVLFGPANAAVPPLALGATEWTCAACTYINNVAGLRCEMCDTARLADYEA